MKRTDVFADFFLLNNNVSLPSRYYLCLSIYAPTYIGIVVKIRSFPKDHLTQRCFPCVYFFHFTSHPSHIIHTWNLPLLFAEENILTIMSPENIFSLNCMFYFFIFTIEIFQSRTIMSYLINWLTVFFIVEYYSSLLSLLASLLSNQWITLLVALKLKFSTNHSKIPLRYLNIIQYNTINIILKAKILYNQSF